MNELFLNSVVIKDFRTFGNFEAEIVPAPGLTLLVGTNGLGKSNFFDALEWGLTGQVRRFKRYMGSVDEGRYLTRRTLKAGSHSVALTFSDNSLLQRSRSVKPASAKVVELLKRPEWKAPIEDIGTYLAFTHFLGQASEQRFTSRDRNEQWASLRGPSGIDRLDEVRKGLRGRATEMAFNRRIRQEKEAIAEIQRLIEEWEAWTSRLRLLRDAAEATGAISPGDFDRRLASLIKNVRERAPEYRDQPDAGLPDRLTGVSAALDSLQQQNTERTSLLQSLADLPQRYAVHLAGIGSEDPAHATAVSAVGSAKDELNARVHAAAKAREALEQATRNVAALQAEITRLDTARSDLEAANTAAAQIEQASKELAQTTERVSQLQGDLGSARVEMAGIDERAVTLANLTASLAEAQRISELASRLSALRSKAAASVALRSEAEERARTAQDLVAALIPERAAFSASLEAARASLEAVRVQASEMASALAAVAAHIHESDTDCPVCRTSFQGGQLKRLAEEAADTQNPALAMATARVAELEGAISQETQRIVEAEALVRAGEEAARTAVADQRELQDVELQIRATLSPEVTDLEAAVAASLRSASEAVAAARSADAQDQTRKAELATRIETLQQDLARANETAETLREQLTALASSRRSALERLTSLGYSNADAERISADLAAARTRYSEAVARKSDDEQLQRQAAEAEENAKARKEQADEALRRLVAEREATRAAADALRERWHQAGLDGAPDAAALEAALTQLQEVSRDIQRLGTERTALGTAYEALVRSRDLQELTAQMQKVGGAEAADAPERHAQSLHDRLEVARQKLHTSEEAHMAVSGLADRLQEEARNFSTQFLTPLNGLIDDFNEALLSTPGESVHLSAAHHKDRTQFDMGLRYRDEIDDILFDTNLPPSVVLSEGQLAANGFSILCSASTAYPWSRWRALLMDDPLQHNDIIHAAAFVDLMRNLVELQKYQLIMSSHDRGEAEFIRRKFDAAGLPCSVVTLTAPSRSWVRYLAPEYNSAAEEILAQRLAQSA
ncbi:AAA family ATPase [Croceicoccus marinus]|uniref:AAA family ATPase n=1 Tax=Croceicoccus marinus TaxID=450378 RepID=A0A7G6VTL3_9SPHN|nr:AAA family ATPase [Croceicoccus marinus]QNE05078.1 AAA family ATPase [Croceicoccus marinus]